ncbi:MAG: hypothetical protein AABX02_00525, partial [archaeon]
TRIMRRLRGNEETPARGVSHSQQIANWLAHQRQRHPELRTTLLPVSRLCLEKATPERSGSGMSGEYSSENAWMNPQTIREIERMIMDQGMDETVMHIAVRHPALTELLTDTHAYQRFIERENIPEVWRKRLYALSRVRNAELRGMGLLVYLRKAHVRKARSTVLVEKT